MDKITLANFEDSFDLDESNDDLRDAASRPTRLKLKVKVTNGRGDFNFKTKQDQCEHPLPPPEVRPIKAIPFSLDDNIEDTSAPSSTKATTTVDITDADDDAYSGNVYDACLLDLPLVYSIVKPDRVGARRKATVLRKPRLGLGTGDSVEVVEELSHQLETVNIKSRTEKKKRHTRLYKFNKDFMHQAKQQTASNKKDEFPTSWCEFKSMPDLSKLGNWVNRMKGAEDKSQVIERWDKLRNKSDNDTAADLPTISKLLGMDTESVKRFDFFRDMDVINALRNANHSNSLYPDLLRMVAFSLWQCGEIKKCAYYLVGVHGTFLKSDISDKHLGVLVTEAEKNSTKPEKSSTKVSKSKRKVAQAKESEIKAELYEDHMSGLKAFDTASSLDVQSRLNEVNPDWTIIQFTSMFSYQNRFHTDVVGSQETPGLFLTCVASPYGSQERGVFTTYIPEPVKNPAVSKWSLIEQFAQLMTENRLINSRNLERREYWETRAEHNRKMMAILAAMEENWLFPWNFVLAGNLTDPDLQNRISKCVKQVEVLLKKTLTSAQKVLLMKLIGNFNFLPPAAQNSVGHLISHILEAFVFPISKIAESVIKLGSSISITSNRHPSIFVLDQEIECLPWEWLTCVRTTSVTRIQSLPILYTTMKLVERRSHVDPNKCFYVLNPDRSLENVQKRLKQYFASRKQWDGVAGEVPHQKDVDENLQKQDVYLYCGHGNGQSFYPDHALQKLVCNAVPLLMGCASAQYKCTGSKSYAMSVVNAYTIAMCPSVVGFLWEVTDVECDRVTVELLERWIPAPKGTQLPEMGGFDTKTERPISECLATAVRFSRAAATQFMTEAAIVNYGLPVYVNTAQSS